MNNYSFWPGTNDWDYVVAALRAVKLHKNIENYKTRIIDDIGYSCKDSAPKKIYDLARKYYLDYCLESRDEAWIEVIKYINSSENIANTHEYVPCDQCKTFVTKEYKNHSHCSGCNKASLFAKFYECGKCSSCCRCSQCACCGKHSENLNVCSNCNFCDKDCKCPKCPHTKCKRKIGCDRCGGCSNHCNCFLKNKIFKADASQLDKINCNRLVGVEWEINKVNNTNNFYKTIYNNLSQKIFDGSCGSEIVTPPMSGNFIKTIITDIGKTLVKNNAKINKQCSVHVHVDGRDLEWEHINKLIQVYIRLEPILYFLGGPERISNSFCKPCGYNYKNILSSKDKEKIKSKIINYAINSYDPEYYIQNDGGKKAPGRYKGLNLCPWIIGKPKNKSDSTIEFRIHQKSLNSKDIINWAVLCAKIVEFSKNATDYEINELNDMADSSAIKLIAPEVISWVRGKIRARKDFLTKKIEYNKGKFSIVKKVK